MSCPVCNSQLLKPLEFSPSYSCTGCGYTGCYICPADAQDDCGGHTEEHTSILGEKFYSLSWEDGVKYLNGRFGYRNWYLCYYDGLTWIDSGKDIFPADVLLKGDYIRVDNTHSQDLPEEEECEDPSGYSWQPGNEFTFGMMTMYRDNGDGSTEDLLAF